MLYDFSSAKGDIGLLRQMIIGVKKNSAFKKLFSAFLLSVEKTRLFDF